MEQKLILLSEGFPKAVQVIFIGTSTGAKRGEQTWAGERPHSSEELKILSIKQIETDQMLKYNKCWSFQDNTEELGLFYV